MSLFLGPPNITSKPTDPQDTPSISLTVAHTQAPTDPPSTVAFTTTEAMMITAAAAATTTIPAGEEDVQAPGLTPTDAPHIPPNSETTLLPTLVEEHNITALPPDTPTPEIYINEDTEDTVETESTTEPDRGIFTGSSPQGERACSGHSLFNCPIHPDTQIPGGRTENMVQRYYAKTLYNDTGMTQRVKINSKHLNILLL